MSDPLRTAIAAAHEAGALIRQRFGRPDHIEAKGVVDLVTEVDREAERRIVERLRRDFPDTAILAEEGQGVGDARAGGTTRWLVDPLDGTTNFAHGYPQVSVSIALEDAAGVAVGVVFDPLRDETFVAERGRGARLGDRALHVSKADTLGHGLIATGFPYDRRERADMLLARLRGVLVRARGIRRAGSAALDLAAVAAGRLDGYWEDGLKPWDVAAGLLLVSEAGGHVTDLTGGPTRPDRGEVAASNGPIHRELLDAIREGAAPTSSPT